MFSDTASEFQVEGGRVSWILQFYRSVRTAVSDNRMQSGFVLRQSLDPMFRCLRFNAASSKYERQPCVDYVIVEFRIFSGVSVDKASVISYLYFHVVDCTAGFAVSGILLPCLATDRFYLPESGSSSQMRSGSGETESLHLDKTHFHRQVIHT